MSKKTGSGGEAGKRGQGAAQDVFRQFAFNLAGTLAGARRGAEKPGKRAAIAERRGERR